jgi:hypothetical protein
MLQDEITNVINATGKNKIALLVDMMKIPNTERDISEAFEQAHSRLKAKKTGATKYANAALYAAIECADGRWN